MNSRNIALVALALAAVLFLVPVCSEQSDAVSSEDISLTLPDSTGDSVSITVGNGGSTDFRFYVYNNSDQYLYMTAEGRPTPTSSMYRRPSEGSTSFHTAPAIPDTSSRSTCM